MTNQTVNIEKTIANFTSALGNGVTMTKHFKNAMDYVIAERDTTPIVRLYQNAIRRGDNKSALVVLNTFKKIFVGATETRKGERIVGLKIKGAKLSKEAVLTLYGLAQDKRSMRGSTFTDAFKTDAEASKPKEVTASSIAVPAAKKAVKADIKKAVYMAAHEAAFDNAIKEKMLNTK